MYNYITDKEFNKQDDKTMVVGKNVSMLSARNLAKIKVMKDCALSDFPPRGLELAENCYFDNVSLCPNESLRLKRCVLRDCTIGNMALCKVYRCHFVGNCKVYGYHGYFEDNPQFQTCTWQSPGRIPNGDIIGYKKLLGKNKKSYVAKLLIPRGALRRQGTGPMGKCRAEYAKVLEIKLINYSFLPTDIKAKKVVHQAGHGPDTVYQVGKIVRPDKFDMDPYETCAPGIHFFLTQQQAINY